MKTNEERAAAALEIALGLSGWRARQALADEFSEVRAEGADAERGVLLSALREAHQAMALMNSMIACGEDHSKESAKVVRAALDGAAAVLCPDDGAL